MTMISDKRKLEALRILLILGGIYYVAGAIVHFFGLSVFPFFDGRLYAPYHDTVIALASLVLSLFLFAIAKDPVKNVTMLYVSITGGVIAVIFSIYILFAIDFTMLGAPDKWTQTLVEMILLIFYISALMYLRPKNRI